MGYVLPRGSSKYSERMRAFDAVKPASKGQVKLPPPVKVPPPPNPVGVSK